MTLIVMKTRPIDARKAHLLHTEFRRSFRLSCSKEMNIELKSEMLIFWG